MEKLSAKTPFALAITCAALAGLFTAPAALAQSNTPMVLELYTSQGCSSCPPADRLLAKLAHQPGVYAMSLPVDYWDYIGWKDTFASPKFSARQRNYANVRNDRRVYTPQVLVNGLTHAVGSNLLAIRYAARNARGVQGAMSVAMKVETKAGKVICNIGAAKSGTPKKAGLWLFRLLGSREVAIGRGENHGVKVRYTNIVRSIEKVGAWDGTSKQIEISEKRMKRGGAEGWILLLQAGTAKKPGAVLAAAKAKGF